MSAFSGFGLPQRVLEFFVDWHHTARRDGWRPFLTKVRLDAIKLHRRKLECMLIAVPLDPPLPGPPCLGPIEVRPFQPRDLESVRQEFLPSESAMCARRLAAGQVGLTAFLNGEFAGYGWLCRDDSLERVDLPIGADEMLFTDGFTAPRFRGRGVHTSLVLASLRRARELHQRRLIGYIREDNKPSLAVWLGKMNGRVIAKVEFTRVWTRRRTRIIKTGSPNGP